MENPSSKEMEPGSEEQPLDSEIEAKLRCPICSNVFRTPRALSCMHTFCEECINSHIVATAKQDIACPLCDQRTVPTSVDIPTDRWAKALPINCAIVPLISSFERNNKQIRVCDICKRKNISNSHVLFCIDCQKLLCEACVIFHESIPALNEHTLVPLTVAASIESVLVAFGKIDYCQQHPGKSIDYFCEKHDTFCCFGCSLERHGNCQDVKGIKDLGKTVRLGGGPNKLRGRMNAVLGKVKDVSQALETSCEDIDTQAATLPDQIDAIKTQLNRALDDLKEKIRSDGVTSSNEFKGRVSDRVKKCSTIAAATTGAYSLLDTLMDHGTDSQIFIANRKIEGQLKLYEDAISEEGKRAGNVRLKMKITNALQRLIDSGQLVEVVIQSDGEAESANTSMLDERQRRKANMVHPTETKAMMLKHVTIAGLDAITEENTTLEEDNPRPKSTCSSIGRKSPQEGGTSPQQQDEAYKGTAIIVGHGTVAPGHQWQMQKNGKDTAEQNEPKFPVIPEYKTQETAVTSEQGPGFMTVYTKEVTKAAEGKEEDDVKKPKKLIEIESTELPISKCVVRKAAPIPIEMREGLKSPFYIGAVHHVDERLVVIDWKNSLCCVLDRTSFNVKMDVILPYRPTSLTITSEKVVLIAMHDTNELQFVYVGIDEMSILKTISCQRSPVCVAGISDTEVAVGWRDGFGVITLSGNEKLFLKRDSNGRRIYFSNLSDSITIDVIRSRVYQTHQESKSLYCFSMTGDAIFSYANESLNCPIGVSVDRDGNSYVVCCSGNSVHQVSDDGRLLQVIPLDIESPYTICFSPDGYGFIVTNSSVKGNEIQSVYFKRGFLNTK